MRAAPFLTPTLVLAAIALAGCTGSSGSDDTPVKTDRVEIPGTWTFSPKVIEVSKGTTVTWVNHGVAPHTVTFHGAPFDVTLQPGASATHTFNETGTFEYVCQFHTPDMAGKVIVT